MLRNSRFNKFLLLVFSLSICGLVTEIGMRIFYKAHFVVSGWNGQFLDKSEINIHGSRGRKVKFNEPNKQSIVLLGDSQIVARKSTLEDMPEAILEKVLMNRVQCTSIAAGGWGQDQQYLALKRFFENHRADYVFLWFTPHNDIWNNMFPTHFPKNGWAKPTFWLENNKLIGPTEEMEQIVYATPRLRILEPFKLLWKRPFIFNRDEYFEKNHLPASIQWLKNENNKNNPLPFSDKLIGVSAKEKSAYFKHENFENGKNHWSPWLDPRGKRLEYGIKLTNLLLRKIQRLCIANEAKFKIIWVDNIKGCNDFPSRKINEPSELVSIGTKTYKLSNKIFEDNIKLVMDGLENQKIVLQSKTWWRAINDMHLNQESNVFVMKKISEGMTEHSNLQ